jgi:hypothetical protein
MPSLIPHSPHVTPPFATGTIPAYLTHPATPVLATQVEQPFDIVPMSRICTIIMLNLEETFVRLPPGVDVTTGSAH